MESLIRLDGIRFRYEGGGWLLKNIDLTVGSGEYLAICGANGSGKSTIGYLFNGLIPHFFGGELEGRVTVADIDTRNRPVSDLFSQVGLVLQNADAQLFNSTVEGEIAFGLESLGLPPAQIDARIAQVARTLHIDHLLERSPMTLSGGEKRLAAIAAVVCLRPDVILLDEPYANLDWTGTDRVRRALRDLHRRGNTVVIIEQRMDGFLDDITRCVIVEDGRIRSSADAETARRVVQKAHLIPSYPEREQQVTSSSAGPLLEVRDLVCHIGEKQVLKGVDFQVSAGETVAIVGPNGAGKTTLIEHLNGLRKPGRGDVLIDGETPRGKDPAVVASRIGLSFQNPNNQFFKNQVRDELAVGLGAPGKERDRWFRALCGIFNIERLLDRSPYRLSEGEKKRVALASILTAKPKLVVLDEPTAGQDGRSLEKLAAFLTRLSREGVAILVVTHDLGFARATTDRWIVMDSGRIVADGAPEEIDLLNQPRSRK